MTGGAASDTVPGQGIAIARGSTVNANDTDAGSVPPPAGGERHARSDQAEATGWAAELERLAGGSWMAL